MRLRQIGLWVSGAMGIALVVACSASTGDEPTGESGDAVSRATASTTRFDPRHPSFAADEWLSKLQNAKKARGDQGVIEVLKGYVAFADAQSPAFVKKLTEYASILEPVRAKLALAQLLHKNHLWIEAGTYYDLVTAAGSGEVDNVELALVRAEAAAEIEMGEGVLTEDPAKRAKLIDSLIELEASFAGKPNANRFTYNILLGETYSNVVDLPRARAMLAEVKFERNAGTIADRPFAGTKLYLARKQFALAGLSAEAAGVRTQMERFDTLFGTDFRGVAGGVTIPDDD